MEMVEHYSTHKLFSLLLIATESLCNNIIILLHILHVSDTIYMQQTSTRPMYMW